MFTELESCPYYIAKLKKVAIHVVRFPFLNKYKMQKTKD